MIASYSEVDLVLTIPFPGFSRTPKENWHSPYTLAFNTARRLRRIGYESAMILRPDHWWGALVARLAGIPARIGYDLPETAPFLTKTVNYRREHAVIQNMRLVEHWTGRIEPSIMKYYFPISSSDESYIEAYLQKRKIEPNRAIFCIHPGTGTWVKHWQEAYWSQVADTLTEQLDAQVIFSGGSHELPLVQRIVKKMGQPAVILAGDTHICQLAALFQRARVVLGPDSGPLHLAAAMGTPTVALFGPADPVEFAPWGSEEKHIVLTSDIGCRPCRVLDWGSDDPENHPCVREITVARVLEAARRVVQSR
jgi:ADP-heptose:LPS heptosyltransferase